MRDIYSVINFGDNEHPYIIIFHVDDEVEVEDILITFSKALSESTFHDPLLDAINHVCAETDSEYEIIVADDHYDYDRKMYAKDGAPNEMA